MKRRVKVSFPISDIRSVRFATLDPRLRRSRYPFTGTVERVEIELFPQAPGRSGPQASPGKPAWRIGSRAGQVLFFR